MPALELFVEATQNGKMRSLVEETSKLLYSNDSFTVNLWPWAIGGALLVIGKVLPNIYTFQ